MNKIKSEKAHFSVSCNVVGGLEKYEKLATATINAINPTGYFEHKDTHTIISVYRKPNWFRRLCIKACFGLVYKHKN